MICSRLLSHIADRLIERDQFDVEGELGVSGDAGLLLFAVGEGRGNDDTTLTTDHHTIDADIPAFDDLTLA